MYRVKQEGISTAWLGEQRASRGSALGETAHRLPVSILRELGKHRATLPHPQGSHRGLLARSLTLRGGEEQATLVETLPQRRLGHIEFLPPVTGAPQTEKQVGWPLGKALLSLCQSGGEFVLRWRQSLACQFSPPTSDRCLCPGALHLDDEAQGQGLEVCWCTPTLLLHSHPSSHGTPGALIQRHGPGPMAGTKKPQPRAIGATAQC